MNQTQEILATIIAFGTAAVPLIQVLVKTYLTPTRLAHVNDLARLAVRSADKLGLDTGAGGAAKLSFASELLVAGAKRLGIKLTNDEVLGYVHAALLEFQKLGV